MSSNAATPAPLVINTCPSVPSVPVYVTASTVKPANVGLSVVATPWFNALTAASLVSSLSITAPAAVTFAVSVTSAPVSIVFSFVVFAVKSAPTSCSAPSTLPDV